MTISKLRAARAQRLAREALTTSPPRHLGELDKLIDDLSALRAALNAGDIAGIMDAYARLRDLDRRAPRVLSVLAHARRAAGAAREEALTPGRIA